MYRDFELPKRPNVYDTLEGKPDHQKVWAGERRFADRDAVRIRLPHFFGCNSFVDSEIGRVVAAADELRTPPAILYTTDHGAMLESHCLTAKGPAAYEEICHVPMILRGFGKGAVSYTHLANANSTFDKSVFEGRDLAANGASIFYLPVYMYYPTPWESYRENIWNAYETQDTSGLTRDIELEWYGYMNDYLTYGNECENLGTAWGMYKSRLSEDMGIALGLKARETEMCIRDRMYALQNSSGLIEDASIFLPRLERVISADGTYRKATEADYTFCLLYTSRL